MPEHISPRDAPTTVSSSHSVGLGQAAIGFAATSNTQTDSNFSRGKTIFIDNYDSFTYNVVQFLAELGADLHVYRNDEITLEELIALEPIRLVISPGPGHPLKDSGISIATIKHFAGKIPILGVCMGLQCLYAAYAGVVDFAGEILHGKTSKIEHDGKGLYAGLNEVIGTRYHSLAANVSFLPPELVVTSKTASGVVMGIRHARLAIEAVQFHPESVLSIGGREMIRNFLQWTGPTWADNPQAGIDEEATRRAERTADTRMAMGAGPAAAAGLAKSGVMAAGTASFTDSSSATTTLSPSAVGTILQRIHLQRLQDVAASKELPGLSPTDLRLSISMHLAPPLISFPRRLTAKRHLGLVGVMAEMKRASPSKGDIDLGAHAGAQALAYARAGADVISVLTEPKWFKGSLGDLALTRRAVDALPNRPAILRKDFIIDTYQIDEARIHGADTVLLIVAMLEDTQLKELYDYSVSLGMEPLVEVNNAQEMARALVIGAKVVGVNNRNLHDFNVDLSTTSRLAHAAKDGGVVLCALSGISKRSDVVGYENEGVGAVLVGEALMRSQDKRQFINELVGLPSATETAISKPLVKVCGLNSVDAAITATLAGAHLLGLVFAQGTKRTVSAQQTAEIIAVVRSLRVGSDALRSTSVAIESEAALSSAPQPKDWFDYNASTLRATLSKRKPLIFGVFRDQSIDEIVQIATSLHLDGVQIHGRTEEVEWAKLLPGVWVIKVFHVGSGDEGVASKGTLRELGRRGYHHFLALDTAGAGGAGGAGDGGGGKLFDHALLPALAQAEPKLEMLRAAQFGDGVASTALPPVHPVPVILAGGLTPDNVATAVQRAQAAGVQVLAVDTSSGVETEGKKDMAKIEAFVAAMR